MSDLIERQAAINAVKKAMRTDGFRSETGLIHEITVYEVLRSVPAVDLPDRNVGKWLN